MTTLLDPPPVAASDRDRRLTRGSPPVQPVPEEPVDSRPAAITGPTRSFRVFRYRRGDARAHWDRFVAPVVSGRTTVLDALTWIRARLDPTLDVRHSCFHASCGTCGMRVNGRDVLACVTRLDDLHGDEVTVEPLLNQPVVSDLVVDIEALYESFEAIGLPPVRASELVPGSHPADGVGTLERFEDCIECGVCISACPIAASDPEYAGPGPLAAAWRVVEEPRGADPARVMALVDGEQGAWRCHVAFECSEVCPSEALPGEQVMRLRRSLLSRRRTRHAIAAPPASTGRDA
jgi:succinate dehydrogenase / fumarate reductase iron-sulfur subunit